MKTGRKQVVDRDLAATDLEAAERRSGGFIAAEQALPPAREERLAERTETVLPPAREEGAEQVLPLAREELVVDKRDVEGATTRVDVMTHHRDVEIDEPVTRTRVEVERVPVGRFVEAAPEVRHEGDVMVVPVMEEVVVVERRLRLKEEIRIRTVLEEGRYRQTVDLREQEAVVTRSDPHER